MTNVASNEACKGGTSRREVGCKSSKFLSMVPSFLEQDKDVQRMVQMIRQEEEKKAMLMKEVKMKMGKVAKQLAVENRSSGS